MSLWKFVPVTTRIGLSFDEMVEGRPDHYHGGATGGLLETAGYAALRAELARLEREEFDLVAVGRALIANPGWAEITKRGAFDELVPFENETVGEILY